MTINALLADLGIVLAFLGAAFMVLAILRPQCQRLQNVEVSVDVLRNRDTVLANCRANAYCAAILLAVAVTAEVVSVVRVAPRSANQVAMRLADFWQFPW